MKSSTTILYDVDLACNFKRMITHNDNITFARPDLMRSILDALDDNFLMVKKKIGSDITILAVTPIDDTLLNNIL